MTRACCLAIALMVAAGLLAGAGAGAAQKPLPGFKLDGTKWTYKDDQVAMEGIFLKPDGEGPFPAILISHGKGGNAEGFGPPKAREFVQWGFVCIATNYTHAGRTAKKGDAKGGDGASEENIRRALKCIEILESLPYVDKKRITAYGHSMGGFVTIGLAATHPDRLKAAAISGSGLAVKEGFAAPTAERAAKVRTPFLILHGSEDNTVRPAQAAAFKEVLDKNKVPSEYHVFKGEGHPIDRTKQAEVFGLMRKWFEKHDVLKPAARKDPPAGQQPPDKPAPPAAKAPQGVKVERDLEYARAGDKKLLLDLYLPEKADGLLPVIVGIHGGGWAAGSKDGGAGSSHAARGYAVACINYRLSGEAIFPAQIEDCKAAVRWVRANARKYNLDPERIGATGHSAGGHLASLLGTSGDVKEFDKGANLAFSSRVQAVCTTAGPTDFLQMDAHAPPGAKIKHDARLSPESRLIGGAIQENPEKVARANPISYVTKDDPPFLIVHGDQDPVVPVHQAELLHVALKKAGVEVKLHIVKGGGHGFGGPEVSEQVNAFFDKHLKKR